MPGLFNPLIEPRTAAALALVSICGVGWGLIAAQFLTIGLALSILGAVTTLWLYWADFRLAWVGITRRQLSLRAVSKELWVALGIVAVDVVVPAYLAMVVPTTAAFEAERSSRQWLLVAATYTLTAVVGFFSGYKARRELPIHQGPNQDADSASVYVGEMHVDFQHLQADLYVELSIRAFNGSGKPISVRQVRGELSVATSPRQGGSVLEIGRLPSPRLLEDRTRTRAIPDRAEIFLVFEQRVPRAMADTITATLDARDQVQLGLNDLNIMVSGDGDPSREVRLSIWNGMTLRRWPEWIFVGRIIEARVHEAVRVSASIGVLAVWVISASHLL